MDFPHLQRKELIDFLKTLRDDFILHFEKIENGKGFERQSWDYREEGGGEIAVLRGDVFEKAAVNWSGVGGSRFPMKEGQGPFFATGVSLITHMHNPHAPTVHFNLRFIETKNGHWFGVGYDLSPMGCYYQEDTDHFHKIAKEALDPFDKDFYQKFSQNAREYFYIPHRKKERGVGGVFFDHFNTGDFEQDKRLWKAIGASFLNAILPIYERRIHQAYSLEEKKLQLMYRAHYAEFNLIYDRGTKFGFQSGGNPEAILCSMPPLATW